LSEATVHYGPHDPHPRAATEAGCGVRLAELVAALSLATDLGLGQPQEHIIRQTLIAMRVAELRNFTDDERAAIFYVSLLAWVGCVADAHEMGKWFGDDMTVRADSYLVDMTGVPMMRFMLGHIASGSSPIRRLTMIGKFLAGGSKEVQASMASHCEASGDLSLRLGLGPDVRDPLQQAFERWDGKGSPARLAGQEIARIMRVVHVANDVEPLHRVGGVDAAVEMLRSRRGTEFDPDLVDDFCAHAGELLDSLDELDGWSTLIDGHSTLQRELPSDELDQALEAFADYSDVKSPFTLGHSRGVAGLAADAGSALGLPADDVVLVRRAGLVHDVGMIGVSAGILDKPGPLSESERERIRTHPYLSARVFSKPAALAAIGQLAALHHERLDGSGYPSGVTAGSLPMTARVIAAADVYHRLLEPRPYRPALMREAACEVLAAEVTSGRLDGDAVRAVLEAAGHRVRRSARHPGGLTAREVEVLVLLARARDFDRMPDCFEPTATMRALLPSGPTEVQGATQIVESLRTWFGGADEFEVLDGTVGEVGGRLHVAWRLRLHPTPWGDDAWHVIEQQTYLRAGEHIDAIDLLCSGFQPEGQI
jgi:HD-GYP domain-containing protein (c-di-GMP phosphodiesterase class II)